jgi:hypothetical protein
MQLNPKDPEIPQFPARNSWEELFQILELNPKKRNI